MQYIWLCVLIAAIVLEAVTVGLVSIWFVPGALTAMILAFLGVPTYLQLTVFFGLSILLLVFSRTIWKKYLARKPADKTNADALIGQTAIVTADIDNIHGTGEVKISGLYWSARSADGSPIPKDSLVEVLSIDGVKLICRKSEQNSSTN